MTIDEARAFLADVQVAADDGDDEAAHSIRDQLWAAVLREVAAGNYDGVALAQIAIDTEKITFGRWCA